MERYRPETLGEVPGRVLIKIANARVITSYNSQYYDDEVFNFFFNSVSHSIVDSLLSEYNV